MNKVLLGLKNGANNVGNAIANSRALQIIIVVAILVAVIYIKGRADGKDAISKYDAKTLPNSGSGIPQGFDEIANNLVDDLWDAFRGWGLNIGNYREALYTVMMNYTDDMLFAVYNKFNSRYGVKGGGTLVEEIANTWVGHNTEILAKLRGLGLK